MTKPLWLTSPGTLGLLNYLVDRLDAAKAQGRALERSIKLDAKSFPALFRAEYEEAREQQWSYFQQMVGWGWFELKLDRERSGQAPYERNPRLVILDEQALRDATGRPDRVRTAGEIWREAVAVHLPTVSAVRDIVSRYRVEIPNRTAEEIVQRLALLSSLQDEPLLLREVSARLFWGQSKVLDGRQSMVAAVLGSDDCPFPEMPIQLQVFLPEAGFDGVLFIENQATFEQATRDTSGRFGRLALVFASGFKGTARRLRSATGASVYFAAHGAMDELSSKKFLGWLRAGVKLPSWFWGDLDYSGMQILASLGKRPANPSIN